MTSASIMRAASAAAPASPPRPRRMRVWQWVLAIGVLGAVYLRALPHIAAYDEVWGHVREMHGASVVLLVVAAAWNLATYWFQLCAALPGLSLWRAAVSNEATTAVSNTVPGGGAWGATLTWTMYRRWGFSHEEAGRALFATSVCNNTFKLALPLVAVALAAIGGQGHLAPAGVGFASAAVLVGITLAIAATLRSSSLAQRIGAAAARAVTALHRDYRDRKPAFAARAETLRRDVVELFADRWFALTTTTIVSHVSLYLVLIVSLRAAGVGADEVSWITALAAFALVRVALVVPITPGGAGIAELGLSGALVAAGGPHAEVVAGVLIFRALTWLVPIGLGAAAYVLWLRDMKAAR